MRGRNYYMLGALLRACPQLPVTVDAVEQQLSAQPANLELFRKGFHADING